MNVRNARGDPEHRPAAVPRNGKFFPEATDNGKADSSSAFFP